MCKFTIKINVKGVNNSSRLVTKVCKYCGKEFIIPANYGVGKYCSRECSFLAKRVVHTPNTKCEYCGKDIYIKPSRLRRTKHHCCSKECMGKLRKSLYLGENNPKYNKLQDKVIVHNNGNIYYEVPVENHPFAHKPRGKRQYYKEHRYVVEQNYKLFDEKYFVIINGVHYLNPNIDVHHKNGITTDNSIDNLEPLTRSEHTKEHNKEKFILRDDKNGRIIGVVKRGELLGKLKLKVNQQPSIDRNIDKGSTTNSRVLTSNVEDSNANTSALPNKIIGEDIV